MCAKFIGDDVDEAADLSEAEDEMVLSLLALPPVPCDGHHRKGTN